MALLELFMRNPGRVLTRSQLEEKLYTWDTEVSSNAVEVHIHHLRRKLGQRFIRTIHGVGYTLGKANAIDELIPASGHWPDVDTRHLLGAATLSARYQTRETINELFDTQQLLLAKRLLTLNFTSVNETSLPRSKKYCPITGAG